MFKGGITLTIAELIELVSEYAAMFNELVALIVRFFERVKAIAEAEAEAE
jgi:hypothetical protein